MQERVYKTAVRDTADLKRHLLETWSGIPRTVIYEVIDEWATNTMRQSKGTSLRAVAVTSRLFSELPTFYRMLKYFKCSILKHINTLSKHSYTRRSIIIGALTQNAICLHFLPFLLNICRKFEFLISQGA